MYTFKLESICKTYIPHISLFTLVENSHSKVKKALSLVIPCWWI